MIIFTGTGRSGTGLYAKLFGAHHEYNIQFLTQYFEYKSSGGDPFGEFQSRKNIIKKHLKDVDTKTFRDSSNPYVHFLDALHDIDNDIRIVFGVRDGRDFVVSGITRGYHNEKKYQLFSMIPIKEDPCYDMWPKMTPMERCAWMWSFRNQKALDRLATVPEPNKFIVKLEDINNIDVLTSLEDFVGFKSKRRFLKKRVNKNKKTWYPPKEEWTGEMNIRYYNIAGEMMQKLGYPSLSDVLESIK